MQYPISALLKAMTPMIGSAMLLMPLEVSADDWRLVRESKYGDSSYYDAASVKRLDGGVISLRAKLGVSEYRYEMRCDKKMARLIEEAGARDQESTWFPIAWNSDEELIYEIVCP